VATFTGIRMIKNFSLVNIMAASVDGKIALQTPESTAQRRKSGFICEEDFMRLKKAVATCEIVFIGASTMAQEHAAFSVTPFSTNHKEPEWILFTKSGKFFLSEIFLKQKKIPKSIFFVSSFDTQESPKFSIEKTIYKKEEINCYFGNIPGLFEYLNKKNVQRVALLGGGKLNAAFWEKDLVDRLLLTITPFIIGNIFDLPHIVSSLKNLNSKLYCEKVVQVKDFVFIDYKVCHKNNLK
jgi:2,5-diamino-6-(ribosylamino)-4(3H)-pyrimidinone 5'-phosphate reductase